MRKVAIGFEVHQPFRIRRDFFWNVRYRGSPLERFFDNELNRDIFERVKRKCYVPATKIVLESIEEAEEQGKEVRFFYSVSGTFLEQAERWGKEVLDLFRQLASTKRVEFLAQTYYHSVTSLWDDLTEWKEQVEMHVEAVRSLIGYNPTAFENTELIFNRRIAEEVSDMGFRVILAEGKESTLRGRSPNYPYRLSDLPLTVLFRNYRLSDDVAFRFSNPKWDQYPLTAEKFATWIALSEGYSGLIFVDYETFGEHHWPETGILDFLRWLPRELTKRGVEMVTPSMLANESYDEIEVMDTSSWADVRKDESAWLGNIMQWAYDEAVRRGEMLAKKLGGEWLKAWRYFTTSDHYYYMFVGEGGPMEVHSYFSSFNTPLDAFINEFFAITTFVEDMRRELNVKGEPFYFVKGLKRGPVAWTWEDFQKIVKRSEKYKEFEEYAEEWRKNVEGE
ncbi:MAG: glycoside hydrolase family 57 protein [Thermoprotei archaeon]